jgi:hypothetical protein
VKQGQGVKIEITVKNTGTENWNEDNQVRLAIFQDGVDSYRVILPNDVNVEPGGTYTFSFLDFKAPSAPSTALEYQMVNEGYQYFGEKKRVIININR